jgi:putative protease
MTHSSIELLAPAGNMDSLIAAVQSGADAVYFGTGAFNARANAANFRGEEALRAIEYCHARGVKTNITMNTLLQDREFNQALEVAGQLYDWGTDALIVQDLGLVCALRRAFPGLSIHGSTQMAIHTLEGARQLAQLGASRVVLARETPLEEIRRIAAESGTEIETFVHGALCVSVSGQCLMSSMIGARSGNRGACAQPCRMKYNLEGRSGYLLSLKDLCMLESLEELKQAGIRSLKIEGRMKKPEYVASVVSCYRAALDGCRRKGDLQQLLQVFNRGGFSKGYYFSKDNLAEERRPGHFGVPVGTIVPGGVSLEQPLHAGDEIAARPKGAEEDATLTVQKDCRAGFAPLKLKGEAGLKVYRTIDARLMEELRENVAAEARRRGVEAYFYGRLGQRSRLELGLRGEERVCVLGEEPQGAQKSPLDEEKLKAALGKLGDTPFVLEKLEADFGGEALFMPASALNALRRAVAGALLEKILSESRQEAQQGAAGLAVPPAHARTKQSVRKPLLIAQVVTPQQGRAALDNGAQVLYAQPRLWNEQNLQEWAMFARLCGAPVYLVLPPVMMEKEQRRAFGLARAYRENFAGAVAGNLGQIAPLKELFEHVQGDYTLNVFNTACAGEYLELGLEEVTCSPELTAAQIRDIMEQAPAQMIVYGRLPLMNLLHCPLRRGNHNICLQDCQKGRMLKDRKGMEFQLLPLSFGQYACNLQLLNSLPLDALRFADVLRGMKAAAWRMLFYTEPLSLVEERVQAFRRALEGGEAQVSEGSTGGHFMRGV